MKWIPLTSKEGLNAIDESSASTPVVIFKHSTTCSISAMAKMRLESSWDIQDVEVHYLDLLNYKPLSAAIAEKYNIHHESPQLLLIHEGECIYDASHFDISVEEVKETLHYHKIEVAE